MNIKDIINAYADGSPLSLIAESFNLTVEELKELLISYKKSNKMSKSFTEDFKKVIAERDINGIARNSIAKELGINISTVKKACEKYGQSLKDKAISENLYTRINGDFNMKKCPSCNSSNNNSVDENTTYCMSCDSEHEYYDGYVLKLNFEYLEE